MGPTAGSYCSCLVLTHGQALTGSLTPSSFEHTYTHVHTHMYTHVHVHIHTYTLGSGHMRVCFCHHEVFLPHISACTSCLATSCWAELGIKYLPGCCNHRSQQGGEGSTRGTGLKDRGVCLLDEHSEMEQSGLWSWARNLRGLLGMVLQKIESRQQAVGGGEAAGWLMTGGRQNVRIPKSLLMGFASARSGLRSSSWPP